MAAAELRLLDPERLATPAVTECPPDVRRPRSGVYALEPLNGWAALVEEARAIVTLAAALRTGAYKGRGLVDLTDDEDFLDLMARTKASTGERPKTAQPPELWLTTQVQRWFRWADIPTWFGFTDRAVIEPLPDSLFGALTLQLAFTLTGSPGLVICAGCGAGMVPRRNARAGERSWRERCIANGTRRRAVEADTRARRRAGQQSNRRKRGASDG